MSATILVVDDDTEIVAAVADLLQEEGYEVLAAGNGKQALDLLEHTPVDLIVIDLWLPVMDGWEFRTVQRSHARLAHIPVVVVSADVSAQAEAIAVNCFIRKPFRSEELLRTIERVLLDERRRLGEVVRKTDAFAWLDLNGVVETSIAFASNDFRDRARLKRNLGQLPHIFGNGAQLGQVIVNLLVNAAQAIPAGAQEANEIVVSTSSGGDRVSIEVSDTGIGIPTHLRSRIFEPLFTTKARTGGTGIGLTVSRNIVIEHGGHIEIGSAVGVGTTVHMVLPVQASPAATARDQQPRSEHVAVLWHGLVPEPHRRSGRRSRVLVIDDDALVLSSTRRILEKHYAVTTTESARDGLQRVAAGHRFDAIVCDLTMPDMTCMDFCAQIEREQPGSASCIVFVTGGPLMPEVQAFRTFTRSPWLDKPFAPDSLLRSIRGILERPMPRG